VSTYFCARLSEPTVGFVLRSRASSAFPANRNLTAPDGRVDPARQGSVHAVETGGADDISAANLSAPALLLRQRHQPRACASTQCVHARAAPVLPASLPFQLAADHDGLPCSPTVSPAALLAELACETEADQHAFRDEDGRSVPPFCPRYCPWAGRNHLLGVADEEGWLNLIDTARPARDQPCELGPARLKPLPLLPTIRTQTTMPPRLAPSSGAPSPPQPPAAP
jgi:hypothetical protein